MAHPWALANASLLPLNLNTAVARVQVNGRGGIISNRSFQVTCLFALAVLERELGACSTVTRLRIDAEAGVGRQSQFDAAIVGLKSMRAVGERAGKVDGAIRGLRGH